MKINGIEILNPDFGYTTDITLPFTVSSLGDGKVSIYDEGRDYDRYLCKSLTCILERADMEAIFGIYNSSNRGEELTLTDCTSGGFFPFTPLIVEGAGYKVYFSKVKNLGSVDLLGKQFKVEFEFILSYEAGSLPQYRDINAESTQGSLTLGENGLAITGLRFPRGGFKVEKPYNSYPVNTNGGAVYGLSYDVERNDTKMVIECTEKSVGNILYRLLYNYRGEEFGITVAGNYFPFGLDVGDDNKFTVKLTDGRIRVKHVAYNQYEISLGLNLIEAAA